MIGAAVLLACLLGPRHGVIDCTSGFDCACAPAGEACLGARSGGLFVAVDCDTGAPL